MEDIVTELFASLANVIRTLTGDDEKMTPIQMISKLQELSETPMSRGKSSNSVFAPRKFTIGKDIYAWIQSLGLKSVLLVRNTTSHMQKKDYVVEIAIQGDGKPASWGIRKYSGNGKLTSASLTPNTEATMLIDENDEFIIIPFQ